LLRSRRGWDLLHFVRSRTDASIKGEVNDLENGHYSLLDWDYLWLVF